MHILAVLFFDKCIFWQDYRPKTANSDSDCAEMFPPDRPDADKAGAGPVPAEAGERIIGDRLGTVSVYLENVF